ncbi:MAG: hypothetical protein ACXAD7_18990 [Candidatus Kariarchaeaceae archaeon]|jgi:catechol-2,3-dioxygenase
MKPNLVHIFINVSNRDVSFNFYKSVLIPLGYKVEFEDSNQLGLNNGNNEIWLRPAKIEGKYNRNSVGLNYIAIRVGTRAEVDVYCKEILLPLNAKILYNSPRIFSDFTDDYYAVYFEDPDMIKIEVTSYTLEI